jgi:hypothetical protein
MPRSQGVIKLLKMLNDNRILFGLSFLQLSFPIILFFVKTHVVILFGIYHPGGEDIEIIPKRLDYVIR